jgi:hypothetical protein
MLKFSQFLNEFFASAPQRSFTGIGSQVTPPMPKKPKSHLGLMIDPEEEGEYQNIVAQNIDDPNTPQQETPTGEIGWQETNKAVSNYVGKQLQQMRAQAGL